MPDNDDKQNVDQNINEEESPITEEDMDSGVTSEESEAIQDKEESYEALYNWYLKNADFNLINPRKRNLLR